MRTCIIGAGGAGLCAARHVTKSLPTSGHSDNDICEVVVIYEQSSELGGVWVYDEEVNDGKGKCDYHHHDCGGDNSSDCYWRPFMYKSLRTNLPKELMAFPDFPFPDSSLPSYITHVDVKRYLRQYAYHFGLYDLIKFRHKVMRIARDNSNQRWLVKVKNLTNGECESEEFDIIFVCNGHNSKPHVPSIPNSDQFQGRLMHSCEYRTGNQFSNLRVACLGAGPSGLDIGMDICKFAEKVYLCHKGPSFTCPLPENIIQTPVIREFTKNGIIVSGDVENTDVVAGSADEHNDNKKEQLEVDAVVLCTGYRYDFPFLDPSSAGDDTGVGLLTINDGCRVSPLFQHVVNINQPTMFFIGLNHFMIPFPTYDTQLRFAISILSGNFELPTREAMLEWERRDYEYRTNELGLPPKKAAHFLHLGDMWWEYLQGLAGLANFPLAVPPGSNKLLWHLKGLIKRDLMQFRNVNYKIEGDDFVIL